MIRASARTRPTFLPRKVGKSIRSDAQPFGFPRVLGQTGEAVNSLRSNIRPLVSCLPCAARLRVSRIGCSCPDWFPNLSSRTLRSKVWRSQASRLPRSLRSLAINKPDNADRTVHHGSLLTRRASQPVTGEAKRCLRSVSDEFFSRRERRDAQRSRQAALAGCPFLCLLSFGQAKERRVLRRTRRFHNKNCAPTRASNLICPKGTQNRSRHAVTEKKRLSAAESGSGKAASARAAGC